MLNQDHSIYSGWYFINYLGEGLSYISETNLGRPMTLSLLCTEGTGMIDE